LEIDVTVAGGQYSCISTYASSNVNTIVANVIFNSTDLTSAVDLLFVVKYVTAPLGNCIQVGGSVERCSNLYAWPTEWNQDAVNGQLYTATIDVSAAEYYWPEGQYQVRISLPFVEEDVLTITPVLLWQQRANLWL
jgi:hypothetical protein